MDSQDLADLYSTCVRAKGQHPACNQFFEFLGPLLSRVVGRVAHQYGAQSEIEDLVQEVNLKLIVSGESILVGLPREMPAASAYLSILAANAARDVFRARNAQKRGIGATISLNEPSFELAKLGVGDASNRDLLLAEIEACLPDDRREKVVFRLYYRQGFTAREIASIPGLQLTVKGVESMIFRITRNLRQHLNPRKEEVSGKPS